jgi:SH3-like domain-containing protein
MRGTKLTETMAEFEIGDIGETIVPMNVRAEMDFKSEVVGSMQGGVKFTVVVTGQSNRVLISSGDTTGWISSKTDLDQPLTHKVKSGTGALPWCETIVAVSMRDNSDLKSAVTHNLPAGSQFELIEEGDEHRIKILIDDMIGWITSQTNLDQPLIKHLQVAGVKMPKNLDNYIARVASQANVTKVLSSKSLGTRAERGGVTKTRSVDSTSKPKGSSVPSSADTSKHKKPPPRLSKLACCCAS